MSDPLQLFTHSDTIRIFILCYIFLHSGVWDHICFIAHSFTTIRRQTVDIIWVACRVAVRATQIHHFDLAILLHVQDIVLRTIDLTITSLQRMLSREEIPVIMATAGPYVTPNLTSTHGPTFLGAYRPTLAQVNLEVRTET